MAIVFVIDSIRCSTLSIWAAIRFVNNLPTKTKNKNQMEKLFVYDLETTGLIPGRNGIHQMSGMIIIDKQIESSNGTK